MAITIVEELWTRIRAAIDDKIAAATAAAESAVASAGEAKETVANAAPVAAAAAAAEVEKLKAGAPEAFDTLLEIANELAANETERSALTNSISAKADKTYVDERLASSTRSGISLLPMVPGTNTPMWAASFREVTDDVPPGEKVAYSNNEDASGIAMKWSDGWVKVIPGQRYRIRVWLKADTPDSNIVFWGYGDTDTRGIEGNTLGTSPMYPVWVRNIPTEWTLYEGTFRIKDGVTAFRVGSISWNYSSAGAVQYVSGFEIWPDFAPGEHKHTIGEIDGLDTALAGKADTGHTHTSADITDAYHYIGGEAWSGKVVKTHNNGHIYVREDPPSPDAVPRKQYVDDQVATRAPATHTHTASQISDATTVGRNVLKASSQAAARTAIGAGTSNLALGDTSSTAAAGNHTHTPASIGAAPASHTHTSAEISDSRYVLTTGNAGRVVHIHTDGHIQDDTDPTLSNHLARKAYVDAQVATKANTSHTHSQYAEASRVTALEGNQPIIVSSLPSSPLPGRIYLVTW